jgi:hypothetical protein
VLHDPLAGRPRAAGHDRRRLLDRGAHLPGCFIVNIGDIFETWSGGRFKSTQHRVANIGRERYSFPLFFGLDYDAVVEPLEKFRTPEALEKYPPIKAGEHLMRMTAGAFRYIADACAKGDLTLDFEVPEVSPFRRTARPIDSLPQARRAR